VGRWGDRRVRAQSGDASESSLVVVDRSVKLELFLAGSLSLPTREACFPRRRKPGSFSNIVDEQRSPALVA